MKTLEDIQGRCRIELDDQQREHWLWTGATRAGTPNIWAPNFTADPSGLTMTVQTGVRAVRHIVTGKPIARHRQAFRTCEHPLCVRPDCIDVGTKAKQGRMVVRTGRERGKANRIAAARRNTLGQTKVTPEMVHDAFAMRNKDAAAKHGVHRDLITKIRMGESVHAARSNPFAGLMR